MVKKSTLKPIRPSAAIRADYERRLQAEIADMHASILRWLVAEYRRATPEIVIYASDDSPARTLQSAMRSLGRRWLKRFDELAPRLAQHFATAVHSRSDRALMADLRRAGMSVRFKMTAAMNDAFQATVGENVSLIRSIAEQHLGQVEQLVMRSVQDGRDVGALTKELTARYGVTKRRAAFISLDQNNKATAVMTKVRHLELGITKAKWLHSAGGRHPREKHVAFSGKTYDVAKGHDFGDGAGTVWPGTAINCRCVSVPIVPGFDD